REGEAADDGEREGALHLASGAEAKGKGQQAEEGAEGGHKDRAQPHASGVANRRLERESLVAHPQPREVEEDDPILDDEAYKEDQSHERRNVEGGAGEEEGRHRADEREGRGEEHHRGLDERLELDDHHANDARGGEGEDEEEGAEGLLLTGVLPAELHADP